MATATSTGSGAWSTDIWDGGSGADGVPAKTPIQEIINIGDVSDLVIFFDDHDGRSPENNVYAFSNNFGDGWIVVELGSEPVSKKVMVLK